VDWKETLRRPDMVFAIAVAVFFALLQIATEGVELTFWQGLLLYVGGGALFGLVLAWTARRIGRSRAGESK